MTAERPMVPDGSPKHGTEEFKKAKEAINKEGWEDNAAVIIGTKEELEQRREQLEKGEEAVDLRTFIHLNSKTLATGAEFSGGQVLDRKVREKWNKLQKGACGWEWGTLKLYFKSADGDLKEVQIDYKQIAELANLPESRQNIVPQTNTAKLLLEQNGFKFVRDDENNSKEIFGNVLSEAIRYRKNMAAAERTGSFDF